MSSKAWFPFYVGDYLADTQMFTTEQHGAYILLLAHYWSNQGPITSNPTELQNIMGLSKYNFSKNSPLILKKFTLQNEKYLHKRMDREIAKAVDISNKKAKAGKVGGLAKAKASVKQLPTQSQPQPQLHIKEHKNNRSNGFDRWWSAFPKKVGKKPAAAIWKRIKPDADALIMDTVQRALNDRQWLSGYVPNPTTYLNQERWNDDIQRAVTTESSIERTLRLGKQYLRDAEGDGEVVDGNVVTLLTNVEQP